MVYKFFVELRVEELKTEIFLIKSYQKNYTNQLLENSIKEKYNHLLSHHIWDADLADMQLISKFDKGIRFLLYVTDIYGKYAWVISLKYEKGITITDAFQKISKQST